MDYECQQGGFFISRGENSPIKWVSATGNKHPDGLLENMASGIGRHFIARLKSNGEWTIRSSIFGKESFDGQELQFLSAKQNQIYWEEVKNNKLPKDRYFISERRDGEPQKYVGRHQEFGVGYVMRDPRNDVFTLFCVDWGNNFGNGFEVLCVRK